MSAYPLPTTGKLLGRAAVEPRPRRFPLGAVRARLGFPSPAEDYAADELDLNEYLIRNAAATYLYEARGESMRAAGINDGDLLVVDRSVAPRDGDLVLAVWGGNAPTCKILRIRQDRIELESASPDHAPIFVDRGESVDVFVVVGVVRRVRRGRLRGDLRAD